MAIHQASLSDFETAYEGLMLQMKKLIGTFRRILDRQALFIDTPPDYSTKPDGRRNGGIGRANTADRIIMGFNPTVLNRKE